MKQCTCFALKAINCICAEREDENSFAHWFYGAPHRIKYLRDHPVFLAAQEAWDAAKKQEAEKQEPVAWIFKPNRKLLWPHEIEQKNSLELNEYVPLYTHPHPNREQDEAYKAAAYLAKAIFDSLYANKEPYVSGKVVWELCDTTVGVITQIDNMVSQFSPRHTQPNREWVGLTDEEMQQVFVANSVMVDNGNAYMVAGLRAINIGQAIEAKLKEKNT